MLLGTLILVMLLFIFLLSGLWISIALLLAGSISLFLQSGSAAFTIVSNVAWNTVDSYTLTAIPLFIFMGALFEKIGMGESLFNSLEAWIGRLHGGLLHAGIASCALFAAISGSSVATAAAIGTVAYPELSRRNYDSGISVGSLAAGGTLGILIPPSLAAIVYGGVTGESVGRLFIAGVLPGLLMALLFSMYTFFRCKLSPKLAPPGEAIPWRVKLRALPKMIPILLIMGGVLLPIFVGWATPTEAAAIGATIVLLFGLYYRQLNGVIIKEAALDTIKITSMLMFLVVGAMIFSHALTGLGINREVPKMLLSVGNAYVALGLIMVFYLVMGCFIDGLSMLVMTIPIVYPAIINLGFDGIWFYVAYVVVDEMGMLTPPVGMNLFILQGISRQPLGKVAAGSFPYLVCQAVVLILITVWPSIAVWLPSLLRF